MKAIVPSTPPKWIRGKYTQLAYAHLIWIKRGGKLTSLLNVHNYYCNCGPIRNEFETLKDQLYVTYNKQRYLIQCA